MNRSPTRSLLALIFIAAVLLFAWGASACAQYTSCSELVSQRVTLDGIARGYTTGSGGNGKLYFHPDAPVGPEPHFHILVPCERLRPVRR